MHGRVFFPPVSQLPQSELKEHENPNKRHSDVHKHCHDIAWLFQTLSVTHAKVYRKIRFETWTAVVRVCRTRECLWGVIDQTSLWKCSWLDHGAKNKEKKSLFWRHQYFVDNVTLWKSWLRCGVTKYSRRWKLCRDLGLRLLHMK